MEGYITIVYDPKKSKLRAKAEQGGYVRFPNGIRHEGARYWVEELREGRAGSWIACGKIVQIS